MSKVHQVLATGVATLGMATVLAGCGGNVIGGDGPRPGVAAQVDDTEISLDDVDRAADAVCVLAEADPVNFGTTSRAHARLSTLQQWVKGVVATEHAEANGIEVPPVGDLSQIPGWDDLSEDEEDALTEYAEVSQAVPAIAGEGEEPDLADYDVVINPRYDVRLDSWEDGGGFEQGVMGLSIPVSDEAATEIEAPTGEALQDLPDAELCGERPDPEAAPPLPAG